MVGPAPLKFSGDDWYAAQCGGNLVPNGGSSNLSEAHVHDFEDACVEGCLNYELEVFGVDGFAVVEVVCGCAVVCGDATGCMWYVLRLQ